ncbi:MAG: Alkaline phosphatase synthesis transcriptional regulatory protein PhoP [Anaerolineae bacterium]|nr:Alkaline phosphatase synthesis transcriptional regulatory protein PhoP [Anaerolineae bacterium]
MLGHILIVEDEEAIAAFVQTTLERDGFKVTWVGDGVRALTLIGSSEPDLVILDLALPGLDGLQVCQTIRRRDHYLPIIMLTARDEDVDKIVGLEAGADDYVTKPFNARELLARVRAVLRLARHSAGPRRENRLCFGTLEINFTGRQVLKTGQPVDLTPKEFDLLALLARNPGRVFGRDTLLAQVWGYDFDGDSRTVDVHIQRLRRKLEDDPHDPQVLLTVHSIGYKFVADR